MFSTYPFSGACQPVISYDYIQNEDYNDMNRVYT
ncbi:hypothetical protein Niako_5260 [Niastella koreensis GR20-10]|uniref:Uncharacterized protein n=1 Tax=Niastella koreensis (strain DSM 17620 / KACC 11465 / NBRC 106392 / GR20-10) TaxID=700598 RepID=G8TDP7_NIAKG|nr:hypothetical protein Niako_5260 [Niastella koreensis GR20-10]